MSSDGPSVSRFVGFGASTVAGAGDSQGGFFKRVENSVIESGTKLEFSNEGRGGETVYDMLKRAVKLEHLRPYDVVVLVGCNDMPRANDATPDVRSAKEDYVRYMASLLHYLKGRRSLFISSFLVSEEATGISPKIFGEYMSQALSLAWSTRYDIWDLYGETKDSVSKYWAPDGLHFNESGHALIAEKVENWLTN